MALARALAYDPEILFFDEPLSAIDYKLRKTLEKELKDLHKETGKTFVYITHSLEEAMVMSDRIGVMRAGRLVQVGTPEDIYARPKDLFVSAFMGEVNLIPVRKNGNGTWEGLDLPAHFRAEGGAASQGHLVVRPELMRFLRDPAEADNAVEGRLYNEYSLGSRLQYQVRVGEKVLVVERSRRDAFTGDPDLPGPGRLGRPRPAVPRGVGRVRIAPGPRHGPPGAPVPGGGLRGAAGGGRGLLASRRRAASRCSGASRSRTTARSSTRPTRSG